MAEQNSSSQTEKSDILSAEKLENSATQEKSKKSPSNKIKFENLGAQNANESTKQKFEKSPAQMLQKTTTKIPVKSAGKQSKKNMDNSATKRNNSSANSQEENSSKSGENSSKIGQTSFKIGHNKSKTAPFISTEQDQEDGQSSDVALKNHRMLENELFEKTKHIESLQKQLNDLKVVYESQLGSSTDNEINVNVKSQEDATNSETEDLERKVKLLSEENYELRERLLKKDVEIEKLKTEEPKAQENIINKILKKENYELHHEKEQLKLERDRLRHLVNEKQDKTEKLVTGLKDMEDQLFQAKRALEDRAKAATRLEGRLAKVDSELNRYRERYGTLDRQNKSKRLSEKSRGSRSRSLSPGGRERLQSEQECSENQITMLQQREAKLLGDRRQLEKSVNILTNKIAELEDMLQKPRSEKQPTHERGSQTDLGAGSQLTSTMIQGSHQGETVRKCRGIVQSLGKFFEELIQNNQDATAGGSKSRRTTIAARRASELLHELSMSMDHALSTTCHEPTRVDRSTRTTSPVRRSTAVNTEASTTLWDKLYDEVAQHEFTFDPLSPPPQTEGLSVVTDDKQREIKRAERGLQRTCQENGEASGEKVNKQSFTKEDATKMMNVSRKQTESVMTELLRKHQGEIRALLENACQSSPVPTVAFDISNPEISGQDEATMAVKELDCFKSRTTKVQSLILKLQEIVECAKKDKQSAEQKLQSVAEEIRQKDTLLQAKSLELRRRHGKTLEAEKALHGEITAMKNEKSAILKENARLHELCRQKDLHILQKVQEIKGIQQQVDERDAAHHQNLATMRKKVEEAWRLYESVKTRAEKRTAEFSEAAEKLKASQGYLLDLWQTLKTVDTVVEANEQDEL